MSELDTSMETEALSVPLRKSQGMFQAVSCERIDLRYRVTRDIFLTSKFLSFFGKDSEEASDGMFVTCRTLDPERLDYHVHFFWEFDAEGLTLFISFHSGAMKEKEDEREPYAERFMPWLSTFFVHETTHGDFHAEFEYPLDGHHSRFPLPLKTTISDNLDAVISGLFISFPSLPDGFGSARIRQGSKLLTVDLFGSKRTDFSLFSLRDEVSRLSQFALRLTEEREQK